MSEETKGREKQGRRGNGKQPKNPRPEVKNSGAKWGKGKLKNLISPNTKPLSVIDNVKGGDNICYRADYDSQPWLLRFKAQRKSSKSHLASLALRELMNGLRDERDPMTLVEMQHYGQKVGRNVPDKEGGQWQAHDADVVRWVKMLEETHNLSRKVISRAAIARFIMKHQHELE